MSDEFESIRAMEAPADHLRKVVETVQDVPQDLSLDPNRGTVMESSGRRWTFVMTREASEGWDRLGKEPLTLGVLAYHHTGLAEPFVQRVLVALPGGRGRVNLEMRDNAWRVLWTGRGRIEDGELQFSMPITRARVEAKGMMAGRIDAQGRIALSEGRLPKPAKSLTPKYEGEA